MSCWSVRGSSDCGLLTARASLASPNKYKMLTTSGAEWDKTGADETACDCKSLADARGCGAARLFYWRCEEGGGGFVEDSAGGGAQSGFCDGRPADLRGAVLQLPRAGEAEERLSPGRAG